LGVVTAPAGSATGPDALLVLLPDAGRTADDYAASARAASASADGVRLWTAVAQAGVPTADAVPRYAALVQLARAAGARVTDADTVVTGHGAAAPGALAVAAAHEVAGAAVLAADPHDALLAATGAPVLRLAGELDRSVRVSRLALAGGHAPPHLPVVVLDGVDADGLRGAPGGSVLGSFSQAAVGGDGADLAVAARSRVTAAFAEAAHAERGDVCAELQRHTADVAPRDARRLRVVDRASERLLDPSPEGLPSSFGGFVYDKAELSTEGRSVLLTTNSHVVRADAGVGPVGAPEVMCKTKSRSAVAQALTGDHQAVDATPPTCAQFNEAVVRRAADQVSPAARERFAGVAVELDDAKRAGPEWVFSPLVLRPAPDSSPGSWSVRAPSLVTELTDADLDPRFAGNHYCKVLSPVRALELVLVDAVRG
jgi:hypothetical protein